MKCHRDFRSSERLRDKSKKNPPGHYGGEILHNTHIQRPFIFYPERGSYNLDHDQWCRKKNVSKLITAAKNN